MPNWCQNSIMIPLTHKKAFMRKFTTKRRMVYFLGKGQFLSEPIEHCLSFHRILRMPTLPEVMQRKWLEQNCGTTHNAHDAHFAIHDDCEHAGMFEITFDTAWSPAGEKLIEQIAKRLHCDVEHVYLEEGQDSYGIREFKFETGEHSDEPELFFMQTAEDNEDTYQTIVTRFFGYSEYADELMERYMENTQ
ncbi:DUF1281 family ferredoxin-like fold protein [Acinetobacter brisouii]|uniref:DUF1281 family ferredoxin-like fold protein n=1 Tax=Acinetobacter brisouii TaxID=396323 RepID=UPI00124C25F9|nr:hypothetical protein [Acinetobacter brisouii]